MHKKATFLVVSEASEAIVLPTPGVNARALNDSAGFPDCLIRMRMGALPLSFISYYYCIGVMTPWQRWRNGLWMGIGAGTRGWGLEECVGVWVGVWRRTVYL